jgi:WD40 repeat protein
LSRLLFASLAALAVSLSATAGPCRAQQALPPLPSAESPDKRLQATGTDKAILVVEAQGQRELLRLRGHTDRVTALAFSPDGKLLASGSADRTVGVWDVATGRMLWRGKVGRDVTRVAFSPDGRTLTSREADRTVREWEIPTGKQLKQFKEKDKK